MKFPNPATVLRLLAVAAVFLFINPVFAQRQMERLGRGMVVLRTSDTQVYVGWRLLGNDPSDVGFNLYRSANGGTAIKANNAPLTNTTDYVDAPANLSTTAYTYSLKPVQNGVEVADIWANPLSPLNTATLPANSTARTYPYVRVPIQDTPDGALGVKFCWVGDLDGDGEYDFVIDRQPSGDTRQFLEGYKRDGTFLWRMDMGYNSTNHYNITPGSSTVGIGQGDNVTVFDLDGDGKAEVIVRTARGVVFADGTVVGGTDDRTQYLSILDGLTGVEKARATIPNPFSSAGQMNGNMGILYCDGVQPSIMFRLKSRNGDSSWNEIAHCWDYRNGALTLRWSRNFATLTHAASGHQLRIADPDNDGRDEYLDFGHGLDDDGTQLYANNAVGHGDRYTVGDIDPDRPGLETFVIQQDNPSGLATALYESATGKFIKEWFAGGVVDVGRGMAAPLDLTVKGYQMDSTQPGIFDCKGNLLYANSFFPTEPLWWDSDLCREYLRDDMTVRISKFNVGYYDLIDKNTDSPGVYQADGGRPAFLGDILGDWREDILVVENNNAALRIYISNHPATNRLYTLMQNPQYRDQTTVKGYVQSSMVDYYLGPFMTPPPPSPQSMAKLIWRGGAGNVWDGASANWRTNWFYVGNANTNPAPCSAGDSILFDTTGSNNTAIALSGVLTPGDVTVYSPKDYSFDGTAGSLGGTMKLTKQGRGTLTLTGTNTFTGATTVWDGALLVNGDLQGSPVTVWGGTYGGPLALGKTGGRTSGTGRFSQLVTVRYRGAVTPGTGMTNAGTLTFGNGLKTEDGATFAMDLSDDPSGTTKTNDLINVIGNLTLQGTNTFVIQKLNTNLPPGVYPLIKYTGAFSGNLNNLKISGLDGLPVVLTNSTGQLALLVKSTRPATTINWTGGQGGNVWDVAVTTNWFNGTGKDIFVPQDIVRFDDTGSSNLTANITGSLAAANVVVDSTANYTFSGSGGLVGTGGLTKTNTGTLTINTVNNAYTGRTLISGGTVVVPKLDAVGFPSPLGNAGASPTNLVLSGNATLRIKGESYTDRGMTLNAGTNSLEVYNSADQLTSAGLITGSGVLQKLGPGMFAISVRNSYSGGTIINGGSIALEGNDGNSYGIGTGPVTFINGTLSLMDLEQSLGYGYNFIVPTNCFGHIDFDGRSSMTGSLTGGGTFTVNTVFVRTDLNGDWSGFSGQINIITSAGGSFRCGKTYGYPNAKINVGNGVSFQNRVSGTPTISIGELSGAQGGSLSGGTGSDGTAVNWSVGGLNTSATFACDTYNNVGFIKVGTGTWTWTGTNVTHTGQTTVNGGTLLVNCQMTNATGTVTVGAAGTLGGTGNIGGATTVNGTLSPGNNGIGTLTFKGSVTLRSTSTNFMQINQSAGTKDLVSVGGTLNYGGTLQVTNLAGTLGNGSSFKLFSAAGYAGTFSSFNLPPLTGSLVWDTSALPTTGTISVTNNSVATGPQKLTWKGDNTANAWDVGITADWLTSSNTASVFNTNDTAIFNDVGSNTLPVTVAATAVVPASMVVSNFAKNYTIAGGAIAGTGSLTKYGTGTLALAATNTFTGAIIINNGTLIATNATGGAAGTNGPLGNCSTNGRTITINGPGVLDLAINSVMGMPGTNRNATPIMINGGELKVEKVSNLVGPVTLNGGTMKAWVPSANLNFSHYPYAYLSFQLGSNIVATGTSPSFIVNNQPDFTTAQDGLSLQNGAVPTEFNVADITGDGDPDLTVSAALGDVNYDYTATSRSGGVLLKTGSGTILLSGLNYYSGGTRISAGTVVAGTADDQSLPAQGTFTGRAGAAGALGRPGTMITLGDANTAANNSSAALLIGGAFTVDHPVTVANQPTAGTYTIGGNVDTNATFTGAITVNQPLMISQVANTAGNALTLSGAITSAGGSQVVTFSGPGNVNVTTTAMADGGGQLGVNVTGGMLTLVSGNTYSGDTTVAGGSLLVGGSLGSSTVAVGNGGVLGGAGTINGPVTIQDGGTLTPGGSLNTLTFGGSLTLLSNSTSIFEISKSPATNDAALVLGTVTYSGTLVVTNIGTAALAAGDSFTLFNAANFSGDFDNVALPELPAGLAWNTDALNTSGTLSVVATAPPSISLVCIPGNGLTFSGTGGVANADYYLIGTTNLTTPLSDWTRLLTNQFDNAGNFNFDFTNLPDAGSAGSFYRLQVP